MRAGSSSRRWFLLSLLCLHSPVLAQERAYTTTGTIVSFGPERAYVTILHADIPGFMRSMAMSFHPRTAAQLAGLSVGARVQFTFTVDAQRQLWIDQIVVQR